MGAAVKLYLIAGEPSGDKLGASLMAQLRLINPDIDFVGVGGPLMEAGGLDSLFDMSDLSVMGLVEVLPRLPTLIKRIRQTVGHCLHEKPDALITIDSPDFCLRVAGKVREHQPLKTIHYVAPSVWAWRPERAQKMAQHIDHVLALLPFEPPFMEEAGMSCDFVGHPIVSEPVASVADVTQLRTELGLTKPILTLLPGSRKGEIARLAPVFGEALKMVDGIDQYDLVLPALANTRALIERHVAKWTTAPRILTLDEAQKRALFKASTAALAASGTVSLELAAAGCPHIVAYKANWATTRMVKKLAQIETASLVSILDKSTVVPEFLFETCTPHQIAPELQKLLQSKDLQDEQKQGFDRAMALLGRGQDGLASLAARSVLAQL